MENHQPSQPLSVLFADVSGSTHLYEALGDLTASAMVVRCLDLMKAATFGQQGRVVETKGDEILSTFPHPFQAVSAATDMMRRMDRQSPADGLPLALRIGIHHGPVLPGDGKGIFGDTVNTAARIVGLAKARQILVSSAVADRLPPDLRQDCRDLQTFSFKGKSDSVDIFEVLWHDYEDVTLQYRDLQSRDPGQQRLILNHDGQRYVLHSQGVGLTIGREACNDIVIDDRRISRNHARIEPRREKFVLIDQSTNGTHVVFQDSREYLLRMEEVVLHGRGQITLGRFFDEFDSTGLLSFEVV